MTNSHQIVFMHISKTAGSNNIFKEVLGEQNFRFYIEWPLKRQNIREIIKDKTFISGHLYFNKIDDLSNENKIKFTLLIEPYQHIVSHILWLDHYKMPGYKKYYQAFHKGMRDVINFITQTDLNNLADLDYLLTNLSPWSIKHFNNCQAQHLVSQLDNFASLSLKDFPSGIKNLNLFNVFGGVKNIKQVVKSILKIYQENDLDIIDFNLEEKINTKRSKHDINTAKSLFRSILSKQILVDLKLYNYVLSN